MNKRYLYTLSILALLAGCEDSSPSKNECDSCPEGQICEDDVCVDPNDPCRSCGAHEICVEGACKPNPDDPCSKCDPTHEECIDNECKEKHSSDDPCSYCESDEICIEKECKPKTDITCDPECGEGKTCVDGRCAICIGTNCFFESDDGNQFCETDEECPEGKRCFEGECQDPEENVCDPACVDGQVCIDGTCQSNTLLWTLCRSGSDCGVGDCIFGVTPSRTTHLEVDGEIIEYTTDKPIPLSVLDSRINPENYNLTHTIPAGEFDDIGVCSFECTKEIDKTCPTGWSCQVVAKGILDYPDLSLLPQDLPETAINQTPFAALCRRDMTEDLQKDMSYGIEFCNADESKCNDAGMIFYNGMCLEPCETSAERCPYFFSCESVETGSGTSMACVPNSGTCTDCYDNDKDGAGYGHCSITGIDCNDDNPNIYYSKQLACTDIVDDQGAEIKTDLNCNGIIDKFELVGTLDNCAKCGDTCATPSSTNITVTCDPVDESDLDSSWRKTATMSTEPPKFACVEKCSFGYGDCKGNASCNVELLRSEARNVHNEAIKQSNPVLIAASDLIEKGKVYALDADEDGYPTIDIYNSQKPDDPAYRKLILDPLNTVICCADNPTKCYTANQDWLSTSTTRVMKNEDGTETTIELVSPNKTNAIDSYDIDDQDKKRNPKAIEICDGKDNDGSKLLARDDAKSCTDWCAEVNADKELIHAETCNQFASTNNGVTTYALNAYCDATEDGSHEPNGWIDIVDVKKTPHAYNTECNRRSSKGDICNTGKVTCEEAPTVFCQAGDGTNNCSCRKASSGYAYRLTSSNTIDNGDGTFTYHEPENLNSPDYIKSVTTVSGEVQAKNCLCNGTFCSEGEDCTDKDSVACFSACNQACHITKDYALACTVTDISKKDGLDGEEPNYTGVTFDGIDDNCNGRVDEDAMIPCIITQNATWKEMENGVKEEKYFKSYLNGTGYQLPLNSDNSVNLCRIGILQSERKFNESQGKYEYTKMCKPLFKPRDYDFYGDAFDSNCDGVDYDTKHTIFVAPEEQGEWPGSDDESNECTFGSFSTGDHVTPCATLPHAIEIAGKEDNYKFYNDILVSGEYTINTVTKDSSANTSYAIKVPTMAQQVIKQQLFNFPSDLPDQDGIIQKHIVSPYKLHALLVEAKRNKSTFDANKYYFSYWEEVTESKMIQGQEVKTTTFKPASKLSEQAQPEEVLRIYGGMSRGEGAGKVPADNDLWTYSDSINPPPRSAITWTWQVDARSNGKYTYTPTKTYALIQPSSGAPLSLKLDSFDLKVVPKGALTNDANHINGATFIGINAMVGAKLLNLNNVNLSVTAADGYSYEKDDTPSQDAKAGLAGLNSSRAENYSGMDKSYVNDNYTPNKCQKVTSCKDGLGFKIVNGEEVVITVPQNNGGCGGHSWTTKNYGYHEGKAGYGDNGGKGGTCSSMGGGDDWVCPKLKDHSSAQGKNGDGGDGGQNGDASKVISTLAFNVITDSTPYSLYVSSDRKFGKGHYGKPGGGGGGGAVFQCWEGNGSNDTRCYAADGGSGGCGGQGGQAGGTGGSAIGIAIRSTSTTEGSTRVLFGTKGKTYVTTTNGSGGAPQPGAAGAVGGNGGYWYAYARCSGTAAICSDTQAQGMGGGGSGGGGGAGGDGAIGVAGWTYPFVFTCKANASNFADDKLKYLDGCGYELPVTLLKVASNHGKQETKGKRYDDIVEPSKETKTAKKGKKADSVADYGKEFRSGIDLRWSRESPYNGDICGGNWHYSVGGGAGGSSVAVTMPQTQEVDKSCLKNGTIPVIIKTIKE